MDDVLENPQQKESSTTEHLEITPQGSIQLQEVTPENDGLADQQVGTTFFNADNGAHFFYSQLQGVELVCGDQV